MPLGGGHQLPPEAVNDDFCDCEAWGGAPMWDATGRRLPMSQRAYFCAGTGRESDLSILLLTCADGTTNMEESERAFHQ